MSAANTGAGDDVSRPLSFLRAWTAHRGALVEVYEDTAEILMPAGLATALGMPEHASYTERPDGPDGNAVWVGYGSPTLDAVLREATRQASWTALELRPAAASREAQARAAAEGFVLRNAVHTVKSTVASTAARLVVYARYSLTADDRRDGLVEETVSVGGRVSVPGFWEAARAGGELRPAARLSSGVSSGAELAAAARAALVRVEARARAQSQAFLDGFARRQERDRRRIREYFDGLRAELRKRARRGKLSAGDVADKEAAIERERASKLQELDERGQVRYQAELAAAVWVRAPVVRISLHARRRKAQRAITLEYDAVTARLLAPACDGCGLDAQEPALCDDELHVICSACVPGAEGRWRCPACRRRSGRGRGGVKNPDSGRR